MRPEECGLVECSASCFGEKTTFRRNSQLAACLSWFFLSSLFDPEDGGDMSLRIVGLFPKYKAFRPKDRWEKRIAEAAWWLIYGLDKGGTKVRFLTGAGCPDWLWGPTSFIPIGYWAYFLGDNMWSYTSVPTRVVMSWCVIKQREIPTFLPLLLRSANSEQFGKRILKVTISYLRALSQKCLGGWGKPRNLSG
jgi:hypothetical protein